MGQGLSLGICIAIPLAVGVLSALTQGDSIKSWYPKLKKPSWTPPNWLFGPMWTLLYTGMGIASWLVFKEGGFEKQALPLGLYGVNLLFNLAWTPLFFNRKKLGWALADILAMDAAAVATTVTFYPVNPLSSYIMLPYLAWGGYATALNYKIMVDNPNADKIGASESEEPILNNST
ncbi:hypothetical protein BSKO_07658 [Bryopsis sp. KO-2023]|nr:hypothetical protein BSKO_07658 [Bryopsis sp. KO-2023]